jgi:hypothetical protein
MPEVRFTFTAPTAGVKARIAINLADTDRMLPQVRDRALKGKVKDGLANVLRMDLNAEDGEPAVEFACDLLTAAATCDIIRGHDRAAGDYPTRVYLLKDTAWVKLPGNAILTQVVEDKIILNPQLFPEARLPVKASPLPTRRVV